MNLLRYLLLFIVSIFLPGFLLAQTGTVTGKLVDAQNKPVAYATVTLMRTDSSVVNGDLSADDGTFKIANTGMGTFALRINAIGLTPKIVGNVQVSAASPVKNLGNIKVVTSTTSLKEVSITGERPLMEMSVDKKVFNVEKNTTTAGGSASDVLQNVPSVSVDVDGTVSLRGKTDVTILIDGKPSTLLGGDVQSALQSLPASSIESVEVITNPSAKYDAQGLTGIINIITKKDNKLGINGNVTLGVGTRDKYNGNLGLNVRKGKWNVFLNSSFRINGNYNNTTTDRRNKSDSVSTENSFHTNEHSLRHFNGFFNSIGASYDFDKNNSLTFTQNVNLMSFSYIDHATSYTYPAFNETGATSTTLDRFSDANGGPISFSSALDYKHKFKKKDEELTVDATFSISDYKRQQHYYTTYDSNGRSLGPVYENAPSTGTNSSFSAWADYTDPLFTKNGKLGFGAKTQLYWFQSSNNPRVDTPGGMQGVLDKTLLANFNYTQQINAGYVNWNDQIGKFAYQAGLRAENVVYQGYDYAISNIPYTNTFFNFFPSAYLSYQLPAQQSIYLNYSRRTNRPSFWQLLPYKDVSNPSAIHEGNPELIPEFINNVEFSYSKQTNRGDNIILSAYYQYTENLIDRISILDSSASGSPNILIFKPVNLSHGTTYGFDGTAHLQIIPAWDATLNANIFQNKITVGDAALAQYATDQSGINWLGKLNTNIKLPLNFSLQISGQYESPKVVAGGKLNEVYWVDVALRKNLLKGKATIVANVSDVFNTRKYTSIFDVPAYYQTLYRDRETRVGNITFTYRFGKSDVGNKNLNGGRKGKGGMDNGGGAAPVIPGQNNNGDSRDNNLKQGGDEGDQGGGGQGTGTTPSGAPGAGKGVPVPPGKPAAGQGAKTPVPAEGTAKPVIQPPAPSVTPADSTAAPVTPAPVAPVVKPADSTTH
ncbi:MAG: TonB-dependent receptor [Taibaiella sp.]|nr:TonB-dependent receptor [Taibaiella sp.]